MRRLVVVVALVLVLVPLTAAAAQAVQWGPLVWCNTIPCYGGDGYNVISEQRGDGVADLIYSKGGADKVYTSSYKNDSDDVQAGRGADIINVADGDARYGIFAGPGEDICEVDRIREATGGCEHIFVLNGVSGDEWTDYGTSEYWNDSRLCEVEAGDEIFKDIC
jgi:hypothetical protein